jgi:translation initiation factor 2 subunit 1
LFCITKIISQPSLLDECDLDDKTKQTLLTHISRRLTPQAVKVRADVEVGCCGYEGIDAVKAALRAGMALSTEELQVKINLIAPPLYVLTTQTMEKEEGLKVLQEALDKIETTIKSFGGIFNIQQAVRLTLILLLWLSDKRVLF